MLTHNIILDVRRTAISYLLIGFITLPVFLLGGCYYEIHDARTGRIYYSDRWVAADGYRGALAFEDYTGAKRRIEHAVVLRLNRNDYLDATAAPEHAPQPHSSDSPVTPPERMRD